MGDQDEQSEEQSFSELTVELVEQAARLAGERLSAPIRAAGTRFLRALVPTVAALLSLTAGTVFLGVAIGHAVGLAPFRQRWWIYLLVAGGFLVTAAILGTLATRARTSEAEAGGETETE